MIMTDFTDIIVKYLYSFVSLIILLIFSGFFSGSETALFSLTGYERSHLKKTAARASAIIENLLSQPQDLLMTILFSNMAVNISIFAISTMLVYEFAVAGYKLFAGSLGVVVLIMVILFGEILPKAIAYHLRIPFSTIVAPPIWILTRILEPIIAVLNKLFVMPAVRLTIGTKKEEYITIEELRNLLKLAKEDGYFQPAQTQLLEKVAELREMTVKQLMTPRVEMTVCEINQPIETLITLIRQTASLTVAIYESEIDNVIGTVNAKRVFLDNPGKISEIIEPATFVPEHQRIDQLLRELRRKQTDVVIVVDEYGGLSGMVGIKEVAEFITGKSGEELPQPKMPSIIKISENTYIADGNLPIEQFCEKLNLKLPDTQVETLAGLMLDLLGHLPQQGESTEYDDITMTAQKVEQNRVTKILIKRQHIEQEKKQ